MLQDIVTEYSLREIPHPAYNLDIFLEYCKYIVKHKNRPIGIIIPINMRSFSPEWDKRPEYQFVKEKMILKGGIYLKIIKILNCFNFDFNPKTQWLFENTPVYNGNKYIGKVKDFINLNYLENKIKDKLIFDYMYPLKKEHRKIVSMKNIVKILNKNNIKPIFYITPIDYEIGEKYLPDQFVKRLSKNTKVIGSVLKKEKTDVLDLSLSLRSNYFNWKDMYFPNEHLKENGRMLVAIALSKYIKKEIK